MVEINLKVLILHENVQKEDHLHSHVIILPKNANRNSEEYLNQKSVEVDNNRNLYAAEYMRQNSVYVDICQHSSNQVLRALTKPFTLFFLNVPDAVNDYQKYSHYDVLFSISDYDAFSTELFRRLIHSKTSHVAISYELSNLLMASPRARFIKKILGLEQIYRHLLSKITLIIFYSKSQMLYMRSFLGLPEKRTRFIPLSVDTEYFRPQNGKNSYVLSVGRDAGRDYEILLRAFKNIDDKLCIVSGKNNLKGKTIPQLTSIVELPFTSLRNVIRHSKFVVLPIRNYQSISGQLVLLQSFSMGKAVIATKCWGTEDYLVDGKTGFFVKAGDEDELRDKIRYLLRNPDVAESVGKNARKYVERECDLRAYSLNLMKLLKEASGEHASSSENQKRNLFNS
jgi:glycosyltransferase involved in cell wall biosynthesis